MLEEVGVGHEPWPTTVDVLLVEDDELVRMCLGEVLAEAGWRVAAAAGAGQASRMADTCAAPSVLVTDLRLGRCVDGPALIAAARHRWPGVGAVLMSGDLVEEPALGPRDRFLRKPFGTEALVQAVAELAAGQAAWDRSAAGSTRSDPGPR